MKGLCPSWAACLLNSEAIAPATRLPDETQLTASVPPTMYMALLRFKGADARTIFKIDQQLANVAYLA